MDHFRDIMIIISAIGLIIIMIILFSVFAGSRKKNMKTENDIPKEKNNIEMDIELDEYTNQEYIISPDDFIFPVLTTFDMTTDFEEFLPKKKYELPEMNVIVDNYKELFNISIEESLKFNFEKRKKD